MSLSFPTQTKLLEKTCDSLIKFKIYGKRTNYKLTKVSWKNVCILDRKIVYLELFIYSCCHLSYMLLEKYTTFFFLRKRCWLQWSTLAWNQNPGIRQAPYSPDSLSGDIAKIVWIKCATPVVQSFPLQSKSDERTQMLLAINWRHWKAGKNSRMRMMVQGWMSWMEDIKTSIGFI